MVPSRVESLSTSQALSLELRGAPFLTPEWPSPCSSVLVAFPSVSWPFAPLAFPRRDERVGTPADCCARRRSRCAPRAALPRHLRRRRAALGGAFPRHRARLPRAGQGGRLRHPRAHRGLHAALSVRLATGARPGHRAALLRSAGPRGLRFPAARPWRATPRAAATPARHGAGGRAQATPGAPGAELCGCGSASWLGAADTCDRCLPARSGPSCLAHPGSRQRVKPLSLLSPRPESPCPVRQGSPGRGAGHNACTNSTT